jgi:hypothetical protein
MAEARNEKDCDDREAGLSDGTPLRQEVTEKRSSFLCVLENWFGVSPRRRDRHTRATA